MVREYQMKKFDARKLSHKTHEEIRIRAVKQVQSGESPEVVIVGFHRVDLGGVDNYINHQKSLFLSQISEN